VVVWFADFSAGLWCSCGDGGASGAHLRNAIDHDLASSLPHFFSLPSFNFFSLRIFCLLGATQGIILRLIPGLYLFHVFVNFLTLPRRRHLSLPSAGFFLIHRMCSSFSFDSLVFYSVSLLLVFPTIIFNYFNLSAASQQKKTSFLFKLVPMAIEVDF
jgi:hypothetical protein